MPSEATIASRIDAINAQIAHANPDQLAPNLVAKLIAVSKTRPASDVAAALARGVHDFGENYVQEAVTKIAELVSLRSQLNWHFIGHLQSNKADVVATNFDWVHSVDRAKLITALARGRSVLSLPLNVLIQVNIDDEDSKGGCHPYAVETLADLVIAQPTLRLRGLMTIGSVTATPDGKRASFARMHELFTQLQNQFPVDTLSMGMSDDFELAIAEGSTMVRIGSALFGARPTKETNV